MRAMLLAAMSLLGCASAFERNDTVVIDFPLQSDAWTGADVVATMKIPGVIVSTERDGIPCDWVRISSSGTDYVVVADVVATIKGANCDASALPGRLTLHTRVGP